MGLGAVPLEAMAVVFSTRGEGVFGLNERTYLQTLCVKYVLNIVLRKKNGS